jgi:hypothetical protein
MTLRFNVTQLAGLPGRKITSLRGVAFVLPLTVDPELIEPKDAAVRSEFRRDDSDSLVIRC